MTEHQHDHQPTGSDGEPRVDEGSGRLERHCSQCGSLISAMDEYCGMCALEASGGELGEEG